MNLFEGEGLKVFRIGFDNEKYLHLQSQHIKERISKFGGKLYLEFGGKLFDDYHASRVLPGFKPGIKIDMLTALKDEAEIVRWMYKMCINGFSLLQIQAELIRMGINSPTGKEEWSVVTISKTLDNINNCYIVSEEEYELATKEKMYRARNDRRKW